MADEASANETVANGMEVSDFLAEFVDVVNKSLSNMESRIVRQVLAAVESSSDNQANFGKSLAGALHTLGEGLVAQTQRVDQLETTPARGPKSHEMHKSLDGAGGKELSKSQIAYAMVEMVEQKKLDPREVISFESNGTISENTLNKVRAHRAGK